MVADVVLSQFVASGSSISPDTTIFPLSKDKIKTEPNQRIQPTAPSGLG